MFEIARTIAIGATAGYLLLLLIVFTSSDSLLFPMRPNAYSIPGLLQLPTQPNGEIVALHLENPEARVTLLYSHGNGEDLESALPLLSEYRRRGFAVLAYDYPGYGRSPGQSSEQGAYRAIDACYRFLREERNIRPEEIVLYGRSLGSGPSVDLASREPVGGLVLEGGFVSAFRVMTRVRMLPWDKFENQRKLADVECPVLVIQAANDKVVGYWHGPLLSAAVRGAHDFWRVEGAGHNDVVFTAGGEYWRRLRQFVDDRATPSD